MIGQDRGGRVTHRLILDHPNAVTHAAVLDIIPTRYLYTHVTIEFVQAYFHWFNYLRAAPGPENELKAANDAAAARATTDVQHEYLRTMRDPATIHAMCEDYRASASLDLKFDEADQDKKIGARCGCCGPRRAPWAACTTCWASGRTTARRSPAAACPAGTISRRTCRTWSCAEIEALLKT